MPDNIFTAPTRKLTAQTRKLTAQTRKLRRSLRKLLERTLDRVETRTEDTFAYARKLVARINPARRRAA